jgi:hypothetical protein
MSESGFSYNKGSRGDNWAYIMGLTDYEQQRYYIDGRHTSYYEFQAAYESRKILESDDKQYSSESDNEDDSSGGEKEETEPYEYIDPKPIPEEHIPEADEVEAQPEIPTSNDEFIDESFKDAVAEIDNAKYTDTPPIFFPSGKSYPLESVLLMTKGRDEASTRHFFNANFYGLVERNYKERDALVISWIRSYCYRNSIFMRNNPIPGEKGPYVCAAPEDLYERESMYDKFSDLAFMKQTIVSSHLWLHVYNLVFLDHEPTYDVELDALIRSVLDTIFPSTTSYMLNGNWWYILNSALWSYESSSIKDLCTRQYTNHGKGIQVSNRVRDAYTKNFAKKLSQEGISIEAFSSEYTEKVMRNEVYDDGQVKIYLEFTSLKPTNLEYELMLNTSLSENDIFEVEKRKRRGRRYRRYKQLVPRMEILMNNQALLSYEYKTNSVTWHGDRRDAILNAERLSENSLCFYDPNFVEQMSRV